MLGAIALLVCLKVIGMEARARYSVSTVIGLLLLFVGLLVFIGTYFLLPLFITGGLACGDVCASPKSVTILELLLRALSGLPLYPIGNTLFLALLSLPLLGVTVGCVIANCVHARRALAIWSTVALVVGTVALFPLMVPLFAVLGRPVIGYLGMLVGYGLLWVGSRLLLSAQSQVVA
jgi:hypothetical protein